MKKASKANKSRAPRGPLACVILAAGKGVRMKSDMPKVLHRVGGRPMVKYSLDLAAGLGAKTVIAVLGRGADQVRPLLKKTVKVAIQEKQLGTGHAVMSARELLYGFKGMVLIYYADMPLLTLKSFEEFLAVHEKQKAVLTIFTAKFTWPNRFGRIVRKKDGSVAKIVEAADASEKEMKIEEVNAGIYAADSKFLIKALDKIKPNNVQGEYYLTDIVEMAAKEGKVAAYTVADPEEALGINDRAELAQADRAMRKRKLNKLMADGVSIVDPESTYVHDTVSVGVDTVIYPGAVIEGDSRIGKGCIIGPGVHIKDSTVGNGAQIRAHTVMDRSKVGDRSAIGPSAHLRPDSVIGSDCRIGNFVETKKVVMGDGSKASHLTYLGDAEIGRNVNIGCGTITCNYDGETKSKTIIEDDVFVGSDTQLIAPIRIGKGSYIGSGSTITKDVPPGALSVARAKQKDLPGWGDRKRKRAQANKSKKEN